MPGNNPDEATPHFILVPLLAQGHMIPMVDMACLLADRGALVSLITTPVNAARIKPTIDRVASSSLPIRFVELQLPLVEGLRKGDENFDLLPSPHMFKLLFHSMALLQDPLELYLRETVPPPSCIISDNANHWTTSIARELSIPRFIFHGPSCFFLLASHNVLQHNAHENIDDDFTPVVVPELPHRIEVTRAQAPGWFNEPGYEEWRENVLKSEAAADGAVVNTFYELEPEYVDLYHKAIGKLVLPIGPLSLFNKDVGRKAARGNRSSIDERRLVSWLDSKEPGSVLYVSFGSIVRTTPCQLIETGCGLEASGQQFIWVIKEAEMCAEVEKWMSGGFEERTRGRGLLIIGWAPQVLILSHVAVGGFMTHCGWNSTLEAVTAGVPMIAWPHFWDQFLNEKLIVEVLKIGVAMGAKVPYNFEGDDGVQVRREDVSAAVMRLMDGGEEGEERRKRAKEFGKRAHKAMEGGGSSHENLSRLIQYVSNV